MQCNRCGYEMTFNGFDFECPNCKDIWGNDTYWDEDYEFNDFNEDDEY